MLGTIAQKVKQFFRPPPSAASQVSPGAGVAGLLLETCYQDGKVSNENRAIIDAFLVSELGLSSGEATSLRAEAEAIDWTNFTPIGFATSAARQLDPAQKEETIRAMLRLIHNNKEVEALDNRMIMTTANIFGIKSGRVRQLRKEALG